MLVCSNALQRFMEKRILIIEDDKFLRELIIKKLNNEGYEALGAVDGEEGLEKVKKENPDLILLDLILPGIDGFEVLSKIKEDVALSSIPVIILSKGLKMGAVDYMIKAHFTPGEITEKIKTVLK